MKANIAIHTQAEHVRPTSVNRAVKKPISGALTITGFSVILSLGLHSGVNAQVTVPNSGVIQLPSSGVSGSGSASPRSITTVAQQAARLLKESKPELALEDLEKGLSSAPHDPQLRFLKGVALSDLKRPAPAIEMFTGLTQDFPELPEPYNNLAVLFASAGELDKARNALEAAVKALPNYSLGHENLGDLYARMASRQYERATQANSKNASASEKLSLAREWVNRVSKLNVQ